MRPKVDLNQIRGYGEIVDDSILFFKQNWKPLFKSYFTICGFFWIAGIVIAIFNQTETFRLQEEGESVYSLTFFLTLVFGLLNFTFIILTALSYIALYQEKGKTAPTVEEVWAYVKYYALRVLSSSVLLGVLLTLGMVFCIIPGIYLMPVFGLVITIMVLENGSLSYSFSHGFQLIKGSWWNLFAILFVTGVLITCVMILVLIPTGIILTALLYFTKLNQQHTILMAVTGLLSSLQFLYLLPAIAVAMFYYSLTLEKNDNSLMQRIEMIGKTKQNNNDLPLEEY